MVPTRRALFVVVEGLLCIACAGRPAFSPGGTAASPTLAMSTYYEEGSQLALIVGVRPALSRRERSYIPIEIAVVNKGLPSLTLTRESFTLIDADGRSFPAVGRDELSRGYGSTDLDRRLGEVESIVERKYRTFDRVPSNFTPGFDAGIGRNEVALHRLSYFVDMLYFPNPAVPTPAGPFELLVRVPEMPDPFVVRFFVGRPP